MHNREQFLGSSMNGEQLLSELKSEGTLDSEGAFTVDHARKHERAWEEAGSIEGALSPVGFDLIQQAVTAIIQEFHRLNETVAWHDDSGQHRVDIQRRTEIRELAAEWADQLTDLVPKLEHDLKKRTAYFMEPDYALVDFEPHLTHGLRLAAFADELSSQFKEADAIRRERRLILLMPDVWGKLAKRMSLSQSYARTLAERMLEIGLIHQLRAIVRDEPALGRLASYGSFFPNAQGIQRVFRSASSVPGTESEER